MDQEHHAQGDRSTTVNEADFRVLCCIEMEGGLIDQEGIPILATAAFRRPEPGVWMDYNGAIETCLARGWIKVITQEDCIADAARWANEPHQVLSEMPYRIGSFDFTPTGWSVWTRLVEMRRGVSRETRYAERLQYLWNAPGWVSLLSVSEDTLLRELEAVRSGTDELKGVSLLAEHTLGEVVGPYPIGPWWVNRFYHALAGYRLDIAYEPADLHPEAE